MEDTRAGSQCALFALVLKRVIYYKTSQRKKMKGDAGTVTGRV